ncbi:MAG: hypothetical protein EOM72_14280 [Opitutae bacterium]|nr:hypothetical protein [Opitutae bacterium]
MSLDKAILHGKEWRKPYRKAKAVDATCRNHGTCPACRKARQHKERRREPIWDGYPEEGPSMKVVFL